MATNLVTSIMQSLTPDMIAKIASLLGIDRNIAEKAIGAGIPAILAGFTNLASSPDGARQLSSTLLQQPAGALDQITSAIGSGQQSFAESGAGLLSGLLGSGGTNALATAVGSFAGIGTNTGKSLLGLLGPVVAGALGQQQRSAGLDANGLASLLTSQKDQIAAAMPSGFAKLLSGAGVLGAVDGGVRRTAETISAARGRMADMATMRSQHGPGGVCSVPRRIRVIELALLGARRRWSRPLASVGISCQTTTPSRWRSGRPRRRR